MLNPWFLPVLIRGAIDAVLPWFDDGGPLLRLKPQSDHAEAKRIGIIMAGNVPLVGLHDLISVFAAGHHARVKLSGKDKLLLPALIDRIPHPLPVEFVSHLRPGDLDFLVATGSDNTARYIAHDFAGTPKIIRKNRFSVAVLDGTETDSQLDLLARDVLLYHGMGCRSVSNILLPGDAALEPLLQALDRFPEDALAKEWWEMVRWEKAVQQMKGPLPENVRVLILEPRTQLAVARIGTLNIVRYREVAQAEQLLREAAPQIQCVVGAGRNASARIAFGQSQMPGWSDHADGIDLLELLKNL